MSTATTPAPAANGTAAAAKPEHVKSYDYRDETGVLLFQVCRWKPKKFTQRRPNPQHNPKGPRDRTTNPQFLNNTEGVRRVLYRLPDLKAALTKVPKRWVFLVEGEKSVDALWELGFAATTNAMGAGKWLPEYNDTLAGVNVAIFPDEDPFDSQLGFSPGLRHAEQVADSLSGVAKKVYVVRLPDVPAKGDVDDWIIRQGADVKPEQLKEALGKLVVAGSLWVKGTKLEPRTVFQETATTTTPPPLSAPTSAPPLSVPETTSPVPSAPIPGVVPAPVSAPMPTPAPAPTQPVDSPAVPPPAPAIAPTIPVTVATAAPVASPQVLPLTLGLKEVFSQLEVMAGNIQEAMPDHRYRSIFEWWGHLRSLIVALDNQMGQSVPHFSSVQETAIVVAAVIAKGLVDVKELRIPHKTAEAQVSITS